ncbi:MAG: hypothetical protein D6788_03830 [Planctomycetota bacterium]|nr:MAG: hypothetical protein D6788_03830 [Planctomycetota bacterium]
MAGRFARLEFEEERERHTQGVSHAAREGVGERNYLAEADECFRWGRFEEALRLYTRALNEDRMLIPAWVGQVQMLVELDECHEAKVWSDKALELFRGQGDLLAGKAQACARLYDHKTALACSDASLEADGSSPWRWIVRGEVLLARGDRHPEACFEKALAEKAADWFDRVLIARVYRFHRRITNALVYLKEAAQLAPEHGYVWFETGCCQRELGMIAAARESFGRCFDLRPDYREAQVALLELEAGGAIRARLRGLWRRWRRR